MPPECGQMAGPLDLRSISPGLKDGCVDHIKSNLKHEQDALLLRTVQVFSQGPKLVATTCWGNMN